MSSMYESALKAFLPLDPAGPGDSTEETLNPASADDAESDQNLICFCRVHLSCIGAGNTYLTLLVPILS